MGLMYLYFENQVAPEFPGEMLHCLTLPHLRVCSWKLEISYPYPTSLNEFASELRWPMHPKVDTLSTLIFIGLIEDANPC